MAQRIMLLDDLDYARKPRRETEATATIVVTVDDGTTVDEFEVDLGDAHRRDLLMALKPYREAGRVRKQRRAKGGLAAARERNDEIRAWARTKAEYADYVAQWDRPAEPPGSTKKYYMPAAMKAHWERETGGSG